MSIDNTTYNFCIESLRYIHKILGYDTIIQELNFINHLYIPPKSDVIPEYVTNAMLGLDDMTEYDSTSESVNNNDNNKNIVIETKKDKIKYVRNELPDENRCEQILPTGKRCTFKKIDNGSLCTRHTTK
jgi:hypothetical protein